MPAVHMLENLKGAPDGAQDAHEMLARASAGAHLREIGASAAVLVEAGFPSVDAIADAAAPSEL